MQGILLFVVFGMLPLAAAGFADLRRTVEWFIAVREDGRAVGAAIPHPRLRPSVLMYLIDYLIPRADYLTDYLIRTAVVIYVLFNVAGGNCLID